MSLQNRKASRELALLPGATLRGVLVLILLTISHSLTAQEPAASAPVPPALLHGRTVFLSNAGADSGLFPHPFSGRPSRGYDQFYAALRGAGRYELVSEPGEADLVFELQLIAPNGPKDADKSKGASDPLPMFRLVILDRKTHYTLWAITESIKQASRQTTHDRNFDDALAALAADLKAVTDPAKP
jgi:hypothetical protein